VLGAAQRRRRCVQRSLAKAEFYGQVKKATSRRTQSNEPSIPPELLQALTRKQLLVLERMTKGESNKQIAYNLDIAETTVKAHVSAILRKLNVHNRVQAILSAGDIDFTSYLRR